MNMSIRNIHWSKAALGVTLLSAFLISASVQAQTPEKPAASTAAPAAAATPAKPPSATAPASKPPAATAPAATAPANTSPAAAAPAAPADTAPAETVPVDTAPKPVTAPTSAVSPPDKNAVMSRWAARHLVMLYRKETDAAPNRLEPLVQTSTMALEQQFLNKQYQVLQASPEALQAMDQGPGVVVTFAPDAGLSMIYSVYGDVRPQPGVQVGIAEVRIEARVFVGATLLSSEQGRGQVQTRIDPATREYGERRGFEIAAQHAATDLVKRIDDRLRRLTPQQVEQMIVGDISTATSFVLVKPPAAPAPPAPEPSVPVVQPQPQMPQSASAQGQAGKRWLLSVGVSDYSRRNGNANNNLEGVAYDVQHVREIFGAFGFSRENTRELFNESATVAGVRNNLVQLASAVGPQDTVVVYISGHGSPKPYGKTGVTMPVLYDSSSTNMIDYDEIMKLFGQIPAKERIMIVDTCFAGGAATGLTAVNVGGNGATVSRAGGAPDLTLLMRNVKDADGDIAVLSAARTEETAIDLGPPKGGLFTLSLMIGLQETRGDATLESVYRNYVWNGVTGYCANVRARGRKCQQSPVLGYQGAGNAIRLVKAQ
jgi:caspase domain-containing protein